MKFSAASSTIMLVLFAAVLAGCDRGSKPPAPDASASSGKPAADKSGAGPASVTAAEPPEIDTHGLPPLLQTKIGAARYQLKNAPKDATAAANLGALLYAHGFAAEAAWCFERATNLAGEDKGWWYCLGLARDKAGQRAAAVAAFERVVAVDANYPAIHIRLGDLLLAENPVRAGQCYAKALELNAVEPRAHYGAGCAARVAGHGDEALEHFRTAFGLAPEYADAYRAAADLLQATGQADASAKYRRAAERGGAAPRIDDQMEVLVLRGGLDAGVLCADALALIGQKRFDVAENALAQAREIGGGSTLLSEMLALLRAVQGQYDEAAAEYRRLLAANPDSLTAKSGLAQVLVETNQPAEAERLFREVLEHSPDDGLTVQRFHALMLRQDKPDEAPRLLRAALDADADNATLHYLLAQALAAAQIEEAVLHLRKAIELRPAYLVAREALVAALGRQGDRAAAQAECDRLLQLDPHHLNTYITRASMALEAKDRRAVERVVRQGLQKLPDAHPLANSLAWILATSPETAQRNGAEAVEWAQKACAATRNADHAYLDTLAAAFAEVGRFEEAVKTARQAMALATSAGAKATAEQYRDRLALYEQRQPYHEPE